MSDELLREVVNNFLSDLSEIPQREHTSMKECIISESIEQFFEASCSDICFTIIPEDVPRWQLCLWFSNNIKEVIKECTADDFHSMACLSPLERQITHLDDFHHSFLPGFYNSETEIDYEGEDMEKESLPDDY
jgi:hypothetical protein